jgi:hypothetical protein
MEQVKVVIKLFMNMITWMKPVTYKASDGLKIPAYLTLPKNVVAKNLPTITFLKEVEKFLAKHLK